ncbi:hypothetical protein [Albidovulum sp.]
MARIRTFGTATIAALFFAAAGARADVTAEGVWQGLVDYYSDMGQQITTGPKGMQGDTLVVQDVVVATGAPDARSEARIAEIRLRNMGDGRVEITMSDNVEIGVDARPKGGEQLRSDMTLGNDGLVIIASGSPEDTRYDFTADALRFGMDGMAIDGKPAGTELSATLRELQGAAQMTSGAARSLASNFTAAALDFEFGIADKDNRTSGSGSLTGLAGQANTSMPQGADMQDVAAALRAGLAADGSLTYAGGSSVFDVVTPQGTTNVRSSGGEGRFDYGISAEGMRYAVTGGAAETTIRASAFPVPIRIALAGSGFGLQLPTTASDQAQPFALNVKLAELSVSDEIWAMFDPGSNLPRDPITLVVDLAGTAKLAIDLMSPAAERRAAPPGELRSLDINALNLSAAGAALDGSGALTFDNSLGKPMPVGIVRLALEGGMALIDNIVKAGFLPADQAAGVKMMLSLYAVPEGEDRLKTEIEFRQGGEVYANGQRIK